MTPKTKELIIKRIDELKESLKQNNDAINKYRMFIEKAENYILGITGEIYQLSKDLSEEKNNEDN